jgi:hypothetical protein
MRSSGRREFVRTFTAAAGAGLVLGAPTVPASGSPVALDAPDPGGLFNIRDFGATGDGATKDTRALQAAIDACTQAGGGVVHVPPGRYLTGTITLKDNVTLHLAPTATLLGSTDRADYPTKPFPARDLDIGGFDIWALVYAAGARNIGINGFGTIDGNGKAFPPLKKIPGLDVASGPRPRAIFLKNCRQVALRDFQVRNSACWTVHLVLCDGVTLDGLDLFTEFYVQQDGIIIDSSRHVRISGCRVNTVDDCIVFKTSFPAPCEAITIAGCMLTGDSSAIKFGTQSLGDFRAITIANCAIYRCRLGGLKFETMDGGTLEDVTVSNIAMWGSTAPLFFRIGNRGQDYGFKDIERPRPVGILRNILVSGLQATLTTASSWKRASGEAWAPQVGCTMMIAGLPGHPVENINLSDIHVTVPGRGTPAEAARDNFPEEPARYPDNDMFGVLPAWGFWVRHARGLTLDNVRLDLAQPDARPAFIGEDIADLDLSRFKAAASTASHLLRLRHTRGATIQTSRPLGAMETFLQLEGDRSADVALLANDLRLARQPFTVSAGARAESVRLAGNL